MYVESEAAYHPRASNPVELGRAVRSLDARAWMRLPSKWFTNVQGVGKTLRRASDSRDNELDRGNRIGARRRPDPGEAALAASPASAKIPLAVNIDPPVGVVDWRSYRLVFTRSRE